MKNTILVLGGDGYYGWPLALKVALEYPTQKVIIIDNEWRRNIVKNEGFKTLVPIATPAERIWSFEKIYGQDNLQYIRMDVNSEKLDTLIEEEKPHTIFHLAQQCSAPYSMKGIEEALFTINNNESGNMRLLWAVRKHVPDAHIIKLGSFGEYAQGGIDIAEGYFFPEHKGKVAEKPMPFPRESSDIYHISKINDSNYVSMACRVWKLRITDVMQSTIFGFVTEEMAGCEELYTRCDYDELFGTVLNRFLIQAVSGHPLTVYGKGNQRTGLMALKDSVNSLVSLIKDIPEAGKHKVINHVTETCYSINELADTVKQIAGEKGYKVKIMKTHDPRQEQIDAKPEFKIDTCYHGHDTLHTPLIDIAREMLDVIVKYKDNISEQFFTPNVKWNNKNKETKQPEPAGKKEIQDNQYRESFRKEYFRSERINLNPGTLGTTSEPVKQIRNRQETLNNFEGYPLGAYENGRKSHEAINNLCAELWPSEGYRLTVTQSTSQTMNLLALSLLRKLNRTAKGPFRIVTTTHEHEGGIGCFHHLPEFDVHYVEDDVLADPEAFGKALKEIKPHVALFSHVFYDTGNIAPVEQWNALVHKYAPNCKIILDAAQSLGLYDIPFGGADVVLGSTHKWLHGPHGGGLMWMKDEFLKWIEGIYWSGHGLSYKPDVTSLSIPGGQDFQMYPAIEESLKLFKQTGKNNIVDRSSRLGGYLQKKLTKVFSENGIEHVFLNDNPFSPVIAIAFTEFDPYLLYKYLNEKEVHTKCIKDHVVSGIKYNILRIGVPYFETCDRLDHAVSEFRKYLSENKVVKNELVKKEILISKMSNTQDQLIINKLSKGMYFGLYEEENSCYFEDGTKVDYSKLLATVKVLNHVEPNNEKAIFELYPDTYLGVIPNKFHKEKPKHKSLLRIFAGM